jgi:hypothetical protein
MSMIEIGTPVTWKGLGATVVGRRSSGDLVVTLATPLRKNGFSFDTVIGSPDQFQPGGASMVEFENGPEYDPIEGDQVTVACVRCGGPLVVEYDRGEPQSFEHPGMPPHWYALVDETNCEHPSEYSSDEDDTLQASAEQAWMAAQES